MTFEAPENPNYAAVIVKVPAPVKVEGLDNLVAVPMYGYQVLTQKDGVKAGDLKVLFLAETQLDAEYARENNLYREATLNKNADETGYFEPNARVKAIRLRKQPSNALLMPLESLSYTGFDVSTLKAGDTFDKLNGHTICRKYEIPRKGGQGVPAGPKIRSRIDQKLFPQHLDTEHLLRNMHHFREETYSITTQKLHGTSARFTRMPVKRDLGWFERFLGWLGWFVKDTEYELVPGSRRAIKGKSDNNDFYKTDLWAEYATKLEGLIPDGYVVYGELIGWVDEHTPIQKNYTYNLAPGQREFYVYRVTTVNHHGVIADLSWAGVKEFCDARGLKYVPELWQGMNDGVWAEDDERVAQIVKEKWLDRKLADTYPQAIPLSDPKSVDEGVCVRIEGVIPRILKAKSPKFLEHETKQLDTGELSVDDYELAA